MSTPRPNLFIVGAPKCGTTAWVSYLARHPDIFFCDPKEPHHFNTDIPGFRWYRTQEKYLRLFANAGQARLVGESSVLYLYSKHAAANIAAFEQRAKILIFVRAPEEFIPSFHNQQLYNLDETIDDLARAWSLSGLRSEAELPKGCRDPLLLDYKSIGAFGEQAARYLDHFDSEQVRIVRFEDWVRNPRATHLALMAFLELEDDERTEFPKINAAHDHRLRAVGRLTQRPPALAKKVSRAIRRLPGLKSFRPVRLLRKLNRQQGYRQNGLDDELRQAIAEHYRADQARLDALCQQAGLMADGVAGPRAQARSG